MDLDLDLDLNSTWTLDLDSWLGLLTWTLDSDLLGLGLGLWQFDLFNLTIDEALEDPSDSNFETVFILNNLVGKEEKTKQKTEQSKKTFNILLINCIL